MSQPPHGPYGQGPQHPPGQPPAPGGAFYSQVPYGHPQANRQYPPQPGQYAGYLPPGYSASQDIEHLNILSIFYFVFAGFAGIGALIGGCYAMIGIVGGVALASAGGPPFPLVFACVGVPIMLLSGVMIFLLIKTGQSLRRRRNLTLCQITAAIVCLNIPLGTVLGVFTFIVLMRPSVKALFDQNAAGAFPMR